MSNELMLNQVNLYQGRTLIIHLTSYILNHIGELHPISKKTNTSRLHSTPLLR
jgi:hypothetical protein